MNKLELIGRNNVKPFWSWNDKLDTDLLRKQIRIMKDAGIGGFFMHARGGLITEYMSDEWFGAVEVCLDEADKYGLEAWVYDENGWPSGFANGIVPSKSYNYCQKWIELQKINSIDNLSDNVLGYYNISDGEFIKTDKPDKNGYAIVIKSNEYYVDTFNKKAIKCFINNVHEQYYSRFGERFGTSLKGFFTDEPQYGNNGIIPWSDCFIEKFDKRYNYSLIENLPLLFCSIYGYESFRNDFYNMVSFLFKDAFIKQVYDWCEAHNCKLTGHMMNEESLEKQMYSTAGVMSCYEYFHEPGIDWLGRKIGTPLVPKQLGSVAAQLNKKTLTETFALCGWNVSLNELKWIAQWQYVNGVTSLCPHLEGYTIRGARKRDYPASLFTQLPWFEKVNKQFCDYFSGLGGLLDSGKDFAPLLVIHMIQSAFIEYNPTDKTRFNEIEKSFENTVVSLNANHIPHHYGDEIIMEKYATVDGNLLRIGACEYRAILLPDVINITDNTLSLISDFLNNGGLVYYTGGMPKFVSGRKNQLLEQIKDKLVKVSNYSWLRKQSIFDRVPRILRNGAECREIECCIKELSDEEEICYLVNDSKSSFEAEIEFTGNKSISVIDILTGHTEKCICKTLSKNTKVLLRFSEYSSYTLLISGKPTSETALDFDAEYIQINNIQEIESISENCLTLDKCEYRIDKGEWKNELVIIKLQNILLELKEPCNVDMRFKFFIDDLGVANSLQLCLEDPEFYKNIIINGKSVTYKDNGKFIDESIRKIGIGKFTRLGENTVELSRHFFQSSKVYDVLYNPDIHETEINKLTFDTELESIYITGEFCVRMHSDYSYGDNGAIFGGKKFSLEQTKKNISIDNITEQGFWFFSGRINLKQTINIKKSGNKKYFIGFKKMYAPAAEIYVNSKKAGSIIFSPYQLDITDYLKTGANEIVVSLLSGNRNLLGPHHRPIGESLEVGPSTFTDKNGWSDDPDYPAWTDNYNFVKFGVK